MEAGSLQEACRRYLGHSLAPCATSEQREIKAAWESAFELNLKICQQWRVAFQLSLIPFGARTVVDDRLHPENSLDRSPLIDRSLPLKKA